MRLRTKVIALAVLTIFLASIGAVGVVSAQADEKNSYDTTCIITGYGQVTQPGTPIHLGGQLFAGGIVGPVKVYVQRLGATTQFGREVKKPSSPELVATVNDWWSPTSVSFKEQGDYYVYAVFEGAIGADGNYYRPSQSEMMAVKVTNQPTLLRMHKPSLAFLTTFTNDRQIAFVGDSISVGGQLRSFAPDWDLSSTSGKTMSIYCEYKKTDAESWGTPVLVGKSVFQNGGYGINYQPTQPGYYRFQAKFAGDPSLDASASNYVDVSVKTATPEQTAQLSLTVSNQNPDSGQDITFSGILQTAASTHAPIANAEIWLQVSKDKVNWDAGPIFGNPSTTGSNGAYASYPLQYDPGTYYFRASFRGSDQYTQALSDVIQVNVK